MIAVLVFGIPLYYVMITDEFLFIFLWPFALGFLFTFFYCVYADNTEYKINKSKLSFLPTLTCCLFTLSFIVTEFLA